MNYKQYWNQAEPRKLPPFYVTVPAENYRVAGNVLYVSSTDTSDDFAYGPYYVTEDGNMRVRKEDSHGAYYDGTVFKVDPAPLKEAGFEFHKKGLNINSTTLR